MNICVYGASSNAIDSIYISEVEKLGEMMAKKGHGLVFGAGAQGLMGAAARGVAKGGGEIIGVAPSFFNVDGVLYDKCTEMIFTETMRERKQTMEDRADAFIMTPGGFGTFEEFYEILTLKQLKRHSKPIVVLNTNHYYDNMRDLIEAAIESHFIKPACRVLYQFCDTPEEAIDYIENYVEPEFDVKNMRMLEETFTYDMVEKTAETR